jgi:hypothetical protein
MSLYFVQADSDNGDSLDLFIRQDDRGAYDPDKLLQIWRDTFELNPEESEDNVYTPTRIFRINETTVGKLPWHDSRGCECVEEFDT